MAQREVPLRNAEEERLGRLVGTIEGAEGTFECMVYYRPYQVASAQRPRAYFVGSARKIIPQTEEQHG